MVYSLEFKISTDDSDLESDEEGFTPESNSGDSDLEKDLEEDRDRDRKVFLPFNLAQASLDHPHNIHNNFETLNDLDFPLTVDLDHPQDVYDTLEMFNYLDFPLTVDHSEQAWTKKDVEPIIE